jgi:hypothetical protein
MQGSVALGPGHENVKINGRPALKPNTPFTPHIGCSAKAPWHCAGLVAIAGTAKTVRANGVPLVIAGATDSCKHKRGMPIGGSNVKAV